MKSREGKRPNNSQVALVPFSVGQLRMGRSMGGTGLRNAEGVEPTRGSLGVPTGLLHPPRRAAQTRATQKTKRRNSLTENGTQCDPGAGLALA